VVKRAVLWGVLAVTCGLASAQVYEFSKPNVPVNDDSLGRHHHFNAVMAGNHTVVARGDTVYAVWTDYRQAGWPSNPDIYFARSTDTGRTFLPNIKINDDTDTMPQQYSSICLDASRIIHVVWEDYRWGQRRIFYSKSIDGGRSFLLNQQVNDTDAMLPMVASNGKGTVCVAWWEFNSSAYNIWLSGSTNNGQTFGRKVIVNDSVAKDGAQWGASLGMDTLGRAYVAWVRNRSGSVIFCSRAKDPGDTTFFPSVRVENGDYGAIHPSIVVGRDGQVYVAWSAYRRVGLRNSICFVKSTDGGVTFGRNVLISGQQTLFDELKPSISASESGNVFVVWEDYRNGYRCIYFGTSTDAQDTAFAGDVLVNDTSGISETDRWGASIAVNGRQDAFVTWADNRVSRSLTLYDIFTARGSRNPSAVHDKDKERYPVRLKLVCYPNPFTSFASVYDHFPELFVLYDISGRKVGVYRGDRIGWDVSPGVYFLRPDTRNLLPDTRILRIVKLR
jgi:hypothetical protein